MDAPAPVAAPVIPDTAPAEPLPPVAVAPPPVVAETAPPLADEPAARSSPVTPIAVLLAGLGALALLGLSFVGLRRRTPPSRRAVAVERVPAPEPALARPVPMLRPVSASPNLSPEGAAVALPRELPASFEERDALIRRMVAARPDRANPFASPIQRRRRARLILQSLGRDFGQAEPWIDLSQYPRNWPELATRYAAAA